MTKHIRTRFCRILPALTLFLVACSSNPPLPTVAQVDLERFSGDWYVLSHIPASSEAEAYNGVESYELRDDGKIETTYAFREGGFEGPIEVMNPLGTVRDKDTNATWGMRFFWFLSFEYLVVHLDEDYQETIIARTDRDYAWIMARQPDIGEERLAALEAKLVEMGYDTSDLRRVPQRWPDPGHPSFE